MKEKWYNIELSKEEWEDFKKVLKRDSEESGELWHYEASEAENLIHLEIKCAPSQLQYLNNLLLEVF